jgi:hypothetical protein
MFNALGLVNELKPEVSLHYAQAGSRDRPMHELVYVVVRATGDCIPATIANISQWLDDNPHEVEDEVNVSLHVIRRDASALEPERRKRVMRHAALIQKEFKASTSTA